MKNTRRRLRKLEQRTGPARFVEYMTDDELAAIATGNQVRRAADLSDAALQAISGPRGGLETGNHAQPSPG